MGDGECQTPESTARDELVKLRTGLARLAFKVGLAEHIPGKPGREAPFEVLVKTAETNERGWNALIARLMDFYTEGANHVARIDRLTRVAKSLLGTVRWIGRPEDAALAESAWRVINTEGSHSQTTKEP